jgi:hypothetical protein
MVVYTVTGLSAEQADEPERFGLCEFRNQLRVQPNLSPGYPCRSAGSMIHEVWTVTDANHDRTLPINRVGTRWQFSLRGMLVFTLVLCVFAAVYKLNPIACFFLTIAIAGLCGGWLSQRSMANSDLQWAYSVLGATAGGAVAGAGQVIAFIIWSNLFDPNFEDSGVGLSICIVLWPVGAAAGAFLGFLIWHVEGLIRIMSKRISTSIIRRPS